MAVTLTEPDALKALESLGDHRTVVIRKGSPWDPVELIEFYKELDGFSTNQSMSGFRFKKC